MINIQTFTFGPFQENTYLLYDSSKECIIIDPGCYDEQERLELADFIETNKLHPVRLLNTHCHIDHVVGNNFVAKKYNLKLEINKHDLTTLHSLMMVARMYNLQAEPSPEPAVFLEEGDIVKFGNSMLEIVFTPGHSPGSITFYNKEQKMMIAGDVLFYGSIGRTDFPGGDFDLLAKGIRTKLYTMPEDTVIYPGHGPVTLVGHERRTNPHVPA